MHKYVEQPTSWQEYSLADNSSWHLGARQRLAKLAEIMCTNFVSQHDAVQPEAYEEAYHLHRQLEVDIQLYDTHGEDHGKTYFDIG